MIPKQFIAISVVAFLCCAYGCGGADVGSVEAAVRVQCGDAAATLEALPEAESHALELWPPNHKMHTISIDDCVTVHDDCNGDVTVSFVSASSDEPVNDIGDGNHEPDIVFGCDGVQLRSERQGPMNGRVYTLNWVAEHVTSDTLEGACHVTVPHDRRGTPAVDDGPAYTVDAESGDCGEPPVTEDPPADPPTDTPTTEPPNELPTVE